MQTLNKNSRGNLVRFIQLTLKDIGIYTGNIDGIFGVKTENAVKEFQKNNNLTTDGIVGKDTYNALLKYMSVPTTIPYSYNILLLNILSFKENYPFIVIDSIGSSVMEKSIPYIKLGVGNKEVIYVASTHANEWITSPVLMKFVEDYLNAYVNKLDIYNISITNLYNNYSIYIVPMLNPDGVDLVVGSLDKASNYYINATKISDNFPNIRFPDGWKANILGVDLNLQFPANWEMAKEIKFSQGYTRPAPRDFVGNFPLEAVEAIAIYDFIQSHNFEIMLTYHSQGEVIYYKYLDYNPPNSLKIGEELSKISGYSLELTPYSSSFAGLKDWFIMHYNLPAYTIEVGIGVNPLPISQFNKIYSDNVKILFITPTLLNE